MKVASNLVYGPPDTIRIRDVPKPEPKPREVLVKVMYSSVNRTDDGFLRAKPAIVRLFAGLTKPRYPSLGCEFSGVVAEVGEAVKGFKVGDKVFGFDDQRFGGHAEYKVIGADKMIVKMPQNVSFKQAAAALEGAHYALFYMYKIPSTAKVIFVNGATGAIGSAAIQMLKAEGYKVEASSTTKQVSMVKKLGADKVVDWQKQDISEEASKCDVYFDAVGKSRFSEARKILRPGGLYMSSELGPGGQNPLLSLINPTQRLFTQKNIKFPVPQTRKREAERVLSYLSKGEYVPLIDREYSMKDITKAFKYVESGEKVGNVVIRIT